jgi:predicted aldo/keto reductase-like oxidoreductase
MTWGKQNSEAEAHEQLAYAFDEGINFLDTAEVPFLCPDHQSLPIQHMHLLKGLLSGQAG